MVWISEWWVWVSELKIGFSIRLRFKGLIVHVTSHFFSSWHSKIRMGDKQAGLVLNGHVFNFLRVTIAILASSKGSVSGYEIQRVKCMTTTSWGGSHVLGLIKAYDYQSSHRLSFVASRSQSKWDMNLRTMQEKITYLIWQPHYHLNILFFMKNQRTHCAPHKKK